MAVVTRAQLHRYMSSPKWSAEQEETADVILASVEDDLCGALGGAVITPVEITETITIGDSGIACTSLPVFRVLELGGVVLVPDLDADPQDDPALPTGYTLSPLGQLRSSVVAAEARLRDRVPWLASSFMYTGSLWPIGEPSVALRYLGGWGPRPALCDAILRKASTRMGPRHADTMGTANLIAEAPTRRGVRPPSESFTTEDLLSLGTFRMLGRGGY